MGHPHRCYKNSLPPPITRNGRLFLAKVELRPAARAELDSSLRLLDATLAELELTEAQFAQHSAQNKAVYLLMQIPGIKYLSALTILSEIGDINRFPSAKKLASYVGPVTRISQSGQKLYTGHITKVGRKEPDLENGM